MEHHFRSSQAGILASSLKENEPCPVCGSLNHPQLADFDQKIVYQEDLKKAKKNQHKVPQFEFSATDILDEEIIDEYEIETDPPKLLQAIQAVLNSDERRTALERGIAQFAKPYAARDVAEILIKQSHS